MFISLNVEREAQIAALDALRAEFEAKCVPVKEGSWGYRLLVVDDSEVLLQTVEFRRARGGRDGTRCRSSPLVAVSSGHFVVMLLNPPSNGPWTVCHCALFSYTFWLCFLDFAVEKLRNRDGEEPRAAYRNAARALRPAFGAWVKT